VRGYTYKDIIEVSPDKLPGYEAKIKTFFEEHIHDDEEIRYVLEGSGVFRKFTYYLGNIPLATPRQGLAWFTGWQDGISADVSLPQCGIAVLHIVNYEDWGTFVDLLTQESVSPVLHQLAPAATFVQACFSCGLAWHKHEAKEYAAAQQFIDCHLT
jgi:hypothetical protein